VSSRRGQRPVSRPVRPPVSDPWADDYDFPEDEKYVLWCPGKIKRTHDWGWRYAGFIDTGDPETRWNARMWSLGHLWWSARRAERRCAMRVRWDVRIPQNRTGRVPWWLPQEVRTVYRSRPQLIDLTAHDTAVIPVEDSRDAD
jgi:hypothetical protein